jgi:putative hydrolase of HD superfamily
MAAVLAEHAREPVDIGRVLTMLLVHDLVEIEAGDTFVYDTAAQADKLERETRAAQNVFGRLPGDQRDAFITLWEEFEARESPDARFAGALDRLSPLMLNAASGGLAWNEHGITADRVLDVNHERIDVGAPALWRAAEALINNAIESGALARSVASPDA